MEKRELRVIGTDKTFFTKITNTISKLFIPTKLGFNTLLISMKRNNMLKSFENYMNVNEKDETSKKDNLFNKYEETYALYLEAIDKYVMDSIYKKVRNGSATEFEKNALASYYEVTHLKETEYLEYKYKKQKYLINLDYEAIQSLDNEKQKNRYNNFFGSKMETLYKGLLKHYSIQLADSLVIKDKAKIYDKIFNTLEEYITDILPIKMETDKNDIYKTIIEEYDKFDRFTVGKLDQKEYIEKKMILLGISRQLFTHSLPLIVAEQCYIKLLKDTRSLIVDTRVIKKRLLAYEMLIELIEDYNVRLLSTKIYWDKPSIREDYKEFWSKYREIEEVKKQDEKEGIKQKEILFICYDMKKLNESKKDYSKIIRFYKDKLVLLGVIRKFKDQYKSIGTYTKEKDSENVKQEKEIV